MGNYILGTDPTVMSLVPMARDPTPSPHGSDGAPSILLGPDPTEPRLQTEPLPNKAARARQALALKGLH